MKVYINGMFPPYESKVRPGTHDQTYAFDVMVKDTEGTKIIRKYFTAPAKKYKFGDYVEVRYSKKFNSYYIPENKENEKK